jgi:MAP/microtubule affinity-regulating kinase
MDPIGEYQPLRQLGKGAYGTVYLVHSPKTNELLAIKSMDKNLLRVDQLQRAFQEANIMRALNHENVVALRETFEESHYFHMVMQYAAGGDLLQKVTAKKRLPEPDVSRIFAQLCSAVKCAHENHFIHRDLKLENVFLDQNNSVLLGDWGFAGRWSPTQLQDQAYGSLHYASPEILSGSSYVGPEVDTWSCGVILFTLVTGTFPFCGDNDTETAEMVLSARFHIPSYVFPNVRFAHQANA